MPQPREAVADRRKHAGGAVAVLDVRAVHDHADEKAIGVGDMALAAFDAFARVKAADTAAFRGLDTLAVDHTGARA